MTTTQTINSGPYDVNEPGITEQMRRARERWNYESIYPSMQVPHDQRTLRDTLTAMSIDRPEWRKLVFLGVSDTYEELVAVAQFFHGVGPDDHPSDEVTQHLELHLHGKYNAAWRECTSTERGRAYIAWVREQLGRVL
ncbi:hypothetical protein [Microbacterium dextranolyticum]|uniref:Uncharacterized protein n=1 Tax=Microbacterium dextranolyticum TaxID=36806 RepID=A0A9W6M6M8_9MICO|nr:hypothetical protein [Microbacterium dextranolyticum]MBM7463222.1 hypothetical protein [Microbacterium dextranolyticum]GLJ95673.1 hypothetical protein GCM10017591_17360 [Microbacterium dextranolyticum]